MKQRLTRAEQRAIDFIKDKLESVEAIVIGAGAGLSASDGLDYNDEVFFKNNYPLFYKVGFKTISEAINSNWLLNESRAMKYWGFWANHINTVYYQQQELSSYKELYDLLTGKDYFIITTNADGQFFKGKFDQDKIFAMQGSYGKFQCQKRCHEKVYDNKKMIDKMLEGFNSDNLEIRVEDVPRCPECDELMIPNLRIDGYFVEEPNMRNKDNYVEFITKYADKSIVFLELGVGFNTPVIIRFPFEQMTQSFEKADLIRVNQMHPEISSALGAKGFSTTMDIKRALEMVNQKML